MGVKVLRDAKSRPYIAIVNGRIQRVRPKDRYWALAEEADSRRTGATVRAVAPPSNGHASDDEPPQRRAARGGGRPAAAGRLSDWLLLSAAFSSPPTASRLAA